MRYFRLSILLLLFVGCVSLNPIGRYERKALYYPTQALEAVPSDIGLAYEDIDITTRDDVKLHGWVVKAPGARSTLLFFHGNGGNISHRLNKINMFHKMGINVVIVDYRGYGQSEGDPSEKGLYADALALYDYVQSSKDIPSESIVVYGESLGGAVAIELARQRSLQGLIVDSTFTSIADMAKRVKPWMPRFLITTKMDSLTKVKSITIPKLFIHSPDDEIIPFVMGQELFKEAAQPKAFLQLKGGHNDGFMQSRDTFFNGIRYFLEQSQLL